VDRYSEISKEKVAKGEILTKDQDQVVEIRIYREGHRREIFYEPKGIRKD
jgi:hypothetical protein